MKNEVTLTGTIKNVKTFEGSKGSIVTGWFDQRDVSRTSDGTADREVYVMGINIIALDNVPKSDILGSISAGAERSKQVTLTGRLVTRFDRRQNVAVADRRAPQLQFEVHDVVVH